MGAVRVCVCVDGCVYLTFRSSCVLCCVLGGVHPVPLITPRVITPSCANGLEYIFSTWKDTHTHTHTHTHVLL